MELGGEATVYRSTIVHLAEEVEKMENDVRQIRLRISTKKNLIAQLQALYTSKNHIEKDLIAEANVERHHAGAVASSSGIGNNSGTLTNSSMRDQIVSQSNNSVADRIILILHYAHFIIFTLI